MILINTELLLCYSNSRLWCRRILTWGEGEWGGAFTVGQGDEQVHKSGLPLDYHCYMAHGLVFTLLPLISFHHSLNNCQDINVAPLKILLTLMLRKSLIIIVGWTQIFLIFFEPSFFFFFKWLDSGLIHNPLKILIPEEIGESFLLSGFSFAWECLQDNKHIQNYLIIIN